jgi:hypothetical protein
MARALRGCQPATRRLVEPGIRPVDGQQIIAEVAPEASAFLAPEKLASWSALRLKTFIRTRQSCAAT